MPGQDLKRLDDNLEILGDDNEILDRNLNIPDCDFEVLDDHLDVPGGDWHNLGDDDEFRNDENGCWNGGSECRSSDNELREAAMKDGGATTDLGPRFTPAEI
jgi:hypothetical protein